MNRNGIPDYLEGDQDGDGIPDYLDIDDDGNGIPDDQEGPFYKGSLQLSFYYQNCTRDSWLHCMLVVYWEGAVTFFSLHYSYDCGHLGPYKIIGVNNKEYK